jgi:predicted nucleic acid-binding protein
LRIAVIDSTPLISLTHLELAKELALYFDLIFVPSAVQREVNCKGRFRYRLLKLYQTGLFQRCRCADPYSVELLQTELDEGEAEALVQAQERNARYFIGDEKRAREIGGKYGLKAVGTVRILSRLNLEGRADDPAKLVRKLQRDLRFRVTDEVLAQAVAMAPEPI